MSVTPKTFHVDYVYGPFVGRRQIQAFTIEKAAAKLWAELEQILWVDRRFRKITEVEEQP